MNTNRIFSFLIKLIVCLVALSMIVSAVFLLLDRPSDSGIPTSPTAQAPATETVASSTELPAPTSQPETQPIPQQTTSATETVAPTVTAAPTTVPETTAPTEASVSHSELYVEGLDVEDVITYFNEVCLDAEFVNDGDPSLLQKWTTPICYIINGDPTQEDLATLESITGWLNTVEGFPGIRETTIDAEANLHIYFCGESQMINILGDDFYGCDGGVTFWYMDNEIYNANVCYRTDIDQYVRNSVILEEIFNGLGPVQDTNLREDSIAYSGYSTPQELTAVDELILRLLYHPRLSCGMNTEECEAVIRQLYY